MALSAKQKEYVIERVHAFIAEGAHCEEKHNRCEENARYVAGEQWSQGDVYRQMMRERPAVPFNSVKKVVEAIANREVVERFQPKVLGRTVEDGGIANVLDEGCRWQRDLTEFEHLASMAARSMVMSGYGCMHKYWDPTGLDGDGAIMDEDVPIWEMLWPARARQMNLADRRWHVRGKWLTTDEAEARYGDGSRSAKFFFNKLTSKTGAFADTGTSAMSGKRSSGFGGFGWSDVRAGRWITLAQEEVFVVEAEWIEPQTIWKAAIPVRLYEWASFAKQEIPEMVIGVDEETGEEQKLTQQDYLQMDPAQRQSAREVIFAETEMQRFESKKELQDFMDVYFELTNSEFEDFRKVTKEIVKYAIITDDKVWESGARTTGFSYEFLTCWPVEYRDSVDFIGVVDVAKGPQDYKNALLSNMLAMYMASPKQPLLIEEGAIPNPDEFLDQIARPSSVAFVPDGFLISQRFLQMQSPSFPPMAVELMQLASAAVEEAFGLSSIDLGTQNDLRRVSGNVVQAARTAGSTVLALPFDAIRRFRKRFGMLNVKFLQEFYTPQEILRIVGTDKAEDLENMTSWSETNKFDIKIDEEPVSATERIELIDRLTRTGSLDQWLAAGHVDFETMLDLLPYIPETVKRTIKEKKSTKQEFEQQMQEKDDQIQKMTDMMNLWDSFMKIQPQGQQYMQQFEVQRQLHEQMMQAQQEQEQQQGQEQEQPAEGMEPPAEGGMAV